MKKTKIVLSFVLLATLLLNCTSAIALVDDSTGSEKYTLAELKNMTLARTDIPEGLNSQNIESSGAVVRLRNEESDLHTAVFQHNDGKYSMYISSEPIKYIDENGNIRDRSSTISTSAVTLNGKSYAFSSTDNSIKQYYPEKITDGALYKSGDNVIEIIPVANGVDSQDAFMQNNTVVYQNAFGRNTFLFCKPTLNGVEATLAIAKYTGQSEFSFTVNTNGLSLVVENGEAIIKTTDGEIVSRLGTVQLCDNSGNKADVILSIETNVTNQNYTLKYNLPADFLTSTNTVYPLSTVAVPSFYTVPNTTAFEDLYYCIGPSTPNTVQDKAYIGNYDCYDDVYSYGRLLIRMKRSYAISENIYSIFSEHNILEANLTLGMAAYESDTCLNIYPVLGDWTAVGSGCDDSGLSIQYNTSYPSYVDVTNTLYLPVFIDLTQYAYYLETKSYSQTIFYDAFEKGLVIMNAHEDAEDTDLYYRVNADRVSSNAGTIVFGLRYYRDEE